MQSLDDKPTKQSPLHNRYKPRRPGQSLQERIDETFSDRFETAILIATVPFAVAAMEWMHTLTGYPPMPYFCTALAVGGIVAAFLYMRRINPKLKNLRLGRDGEIAVAHQLETAGQWGYPITGIQYDNFKYDGDYERYLDWLASVWAELARTLRLGARLCIEAWPNWYSDGNTAHVCLSRGCR